MLGLRPLVVALCLLALAHRPLALQEPKIGNAWYEDAVDLGFKVKAPRDWAFVPGSPMERNMIGKYAHPKTPELHLGNNAVLDVALFLVKFDRRPEANQSEERQFGDKKIEIKVSGLKDIDEWMSKGIDEGAQWRRVEELKSVKNAARGPFVYEGVSTKFYGGKSEPQPIRALAVVFALSSEVDVALVGLGPGDKKKWRTFENAYESIAKTLQPVEVAAAAAPTGKDPRSLKRAKLEAEVAKSPGWSLYETPNYFVLSNNTDKAFIEEMMLRLEAIRLVYEADYPPELARKVKARPAADGKEAPPEGSAGGSAGAPEDPSRSASVIDTLELGKCSVVRVCNNREQYHQYGGRQGTSGYFSPLEQELLIYDDKENEGRSSTWGVMNHEGFHQYTFAFFGNLAPHSWYNEGTGDYYSGFTFNTKTKRFKAEKEVGRQDNLLMIRDRYIPLKEFVRWDQSKYYGNNEGNAQANGKPLEGWACYAQGWSLIYFLRTGEKAKGWKKEWGSILGKYVDTLLETGDLDKAVDTAFEGVDWDAFEESWRGAMM